jgi:2',3'-cyclic-nucleotide 2'-phosphodiesterase (5'-nucleotidase family)
MTMIHGFKTNGQKRLRFTTAVCAAFWLAGMGGGAAGAATLAGWDVHALTGGAGNFGASPLAATTADTNVTVGGLTRGAGVAATATAAARAWGGHGWTNTDAVAAIAGNRFATFSITAKAGHRISLASIAKFDYRRSGTGPATGVLQYQVGGGAFADVGLLSYSSSASAGASLSAVDLSVIAALQNVAPGVTVTFRVVNYGGTSGGGTWYMFDVANSDALDLEVTGTVQSDGGQTSPTGIGSAVPASVTNGQTTLLTVAVTPGVNPASSGLSVTADLSVVGGSAAQAFYDDATHGDVTAGDNVFSFQTACFGAAGTKSLPVALRDAQDRTGSAAIALTLVSSQSVTIFHVNDMHARVTPHMWKIPEHGANDRPFELVGGASYLAARMLQLKAANSNALVLDAGDISEGNALGDLRGNGAMIDFYNTLDAKLKAQGGRGIDASVVGNHDIRFRSYIDNLKNTAQYPVISMNICSNGTMNPYFAPYAIVDAGGTKVGILGYSNEKEYGGSDATNLISVRKCDWSSGDSSQVHVKDYVTELRNQGCQIVVLLAHIGQTAICTDVPGVSSALLVDDGTVQIPEVVVSGHWHTWATTAWQPSMLNYKTTFVESGCYMRYIGELTVSAAGRYLSATQHVVRCADLTPEPEVEAMLDACRAEYAANTNFGFGYTNWPLDMVVGYSAENLTMDNRMKWWSPNEYPWSGNHPAGEWICDSMCWKARQLFGSCDLSLETGGGVRADVVGGMLSGVTAGPITFTQVYEAFPWQDDFLYVIEMTGQEISDFFKETGCNAGFSRGWHVTAHDGVPVSITYNGAPIDPNGTYRVAINNYMYAHPPAGVTWSDTSPETSGFLCRDGIVEYMQQFTPTNPMTMGRPRYTLDTEFSGGYRAVVTLMSDDEDRTVFETGFMRLLSATPETLARRGGKEVPANLVNADGTINRSNRLSSIEYYRSFLGFEKGLLRRGDILEIWGKNSFYQGNPEFVDQEGIQSDGVEFKIIGHDESLAQPDFKGRIQDFWNDDHKNHYVMFFARKTGTSTVADHEGTAISIQDVSGYDALTLPGAVGDLLRLTGVHSMENFARRFRCDQAVLASTVGVNGYPPASAVVAIAPYVRTNASLVLTAVANGAAQAPRFASFSPVADAQVASGRANANYGTNNNLYIQSATTSSYGNERAWLRFDMSSLPAGSMITGACLRLYCWTTTGASLEAAVHGSTNDSWAETGITWNTQPAFGAALSTATLLAGNVNLYYAWDVSAFAQSEWTGDKKASFLVKPVAESADPDRSFVFDAREYKGGSYSPQLDLFVSNSTPDRAVARIQFLYRFSTNNADWGAWVALQTVTNAPWSTVCGYPEGHGFYQFYSVAEDDQGIVEPAPAWADAAVAYLPPGSFVAWVRERGLAGEEESLFGADNDGNGRQDGFDYAFGPNLGTNDLLLGIRLRDSHPLVDIPRQDDGTRPYVDLTIRGCTNLALGAGEWTLPLAPVADTTGKPANRDWYEPTSVFERAFFRLDAVLK